MRGRVDDAALIADCTSWEAASISRSSSNCSVICDRPKEDCEEIETSAGICPNCRSSGAVTMAAIVSGLAPGKRVVICMVGKSTCGRGETGRRPYASKPVSSATQTALDAKAAKGANSDITSLSGIAGSITSAALTQAHLDKIAALIKRISAKYTILMVEHVMRLILELCESLSVLQFGELIAHVNYMLAQARLRVNLAEDGVLRFTTA